MNLGVKLRVRQTVIALAALEHENGIVHEPASIFSVPGATHHRAPIYEPIATNPLPG